MGGVTRDYQVGDEIAPLVKQMSQEAINLFEGSAGNTGSFNRPLSPQPLMVSSSNQKIAVHEPFRVNRVAPAYDARTPPPPGESPVSSNPQNLIDFGIAAMLHAFALYAGGQVSGGHQAGGPARVHRSAADVGRNH